MEWKDNQNCWRVTRAQEVHFLIGGQNYFEKVHQAILQARLSVHILGWDIDFRIPLLRPPALENEDSPSHLGELLAYQARRRSDLSIKILIWDHPLFYATDRELFSGLKADLTLPNNVTFLRDSAHPIGSSHHEKLVIIDNEIAFCGGIDLSSGRWDRTIPRANESLRYDKAIGSYPAYRDAALEVHGPCAKTLNVHFMNRWRTAELFSGQLLQSAQKKETDTTTTQAPSSSELPSATHRLAICLSQPQFGNLCERQEVLAAYEDLISVAKTEIYLENQYLTSRPIVDRLVKSLKEKTGPEVAILLPSHEMNLLEQRSMGVLMQKNISLLLKADIHDRLTILFPVVQKKPLVPLKVHTKLAFIDRKYLFVGSANLNDRSMGLDTEVNLCLDSSDDRYPQQSLVFKSLCEAIATICRTEDIAKVELGLTNHSVRSFLNQPQFSQFFLTAQDHRFTSEDDEIPPWLYELLPVDRSKPLSWEAQIDDYLAPDRHQKWKKLQVRLIVTSLIALAFSLLYVIFAQPEVLPQSLSLEGMKDLISEISQSRFSGLWLVLFFTVAGIFFFPLNLFIVALASIYPALEAYLYILTAAMTNAVAAYYVGQLLGRPLLKRYVPHTYERVCIVLNDANYASLAVLRVIPIAPYALVNLFCGAMKVDFKAYFGSTFVGLLPGTMALVFFQKSLIDFIVAPNWLSAFFIAIIAVLTISFYRFIRRQFFKEF